MRTHKPTTARKRRHHRGHRRGKITDEKNVTSVETEVHDGTNVDKIRDILFGSQMRDYEKRFARLEDRLTKAAEMLREDMKKRVDSLEGYIHDEVESLGTRLKAEKVERSESMKEIARELHDLAKTLEKKLSQLEDQTSSGHADLRSRILDQSKQLTGEIGQLRKELSAALDREVETLRHEKTDRAALADLFSEVALRLKDELKLPKD